MTAEPNDLTGPAPKDKRFVRFIFPRGMTVKEMVAEIYKVHRENVPRKRRQAEEGHTGEAGQPAGENLLADG